MKYHPAILSLLFLVAGPGHARQVPPPLKIDETGRLSYDVSSVGDRVPDYSHAGYRGGGVAIPRVQARVSVSPVEGDDGLRIQAAIDHVSALEPDARGLRGAVQLAGGRFEVAGQLKIRASGVVLRGSSDPANPSVVVATGTGRRPLIEVAGDGMRRDTASRVRLVDERVPVGASSVRVDDPTPFSPGTLVRIERPSPQRWIEAVSMSDSPARQAYEWKEGTVNVQCERVVTAVDGNRVSLDAPLPFSLDKAFGGGSIAPFAAPGFLHDVGVERLVCESSYDRANPLDEEHAWNAIDFHAVRDGWVAGVSGRHFPGSVVQLGAVTARITVQDCIALEPVSEDAGYRRMAFHTRGQQTLFLRCRSTGGRNDFSVGYLAAGPNVFLECRALESRNGFSGSIGSWATGMLFDNVSIDGGALRLDNLETFNQGVGWSAAWSMLWQSEASTVVCRSPPGSMNWACGVWGQFRGDGAWSEVNEFVNPQSLYRRQLAERLGEPALAALEPLSPVGTRMAVPRLEEAVPDLQLRLHPAPAELAPGLELAAGWLTAGGRLLAGDQTGGAWWRGRLEPARASQFGIALTRFAPGRTGKGLTDEIPAVVGSMVSNNQVAFRHHYGLWYDRRRIDHQMIRRADSDVWPPFFEMPFARSGQGRAWDGLSRYDLTRYNPWYFARLREFASAGREKGRVLINEMYFQHNILESGAHWVDSPWRPVNCLQETGFAEPPPFTGDTIKMAAEFYDVARPIRRELHRAYIRQCLANLAGEPNVIHTLTAENSGPLHFMQFWLDVVAEWKRETGHRPLIALSGPKDVQEAILSDRDRADLVNVIDLTYWFVTDEGAEFAPAGGTRLAPRQHARLWKKGRPSGTSIAGMVREYRGRFPGKAVISGLEEAEGWSFVAAGGSFPKLPASTDEGLLAALTKMSPAQSSPGTWLLSCGGSEFFIYARPEAKNTAIEVEPGTYRIQTIDLDSGAVTGLQEKAASAKGSLPLPHSPGRGDAFWIVRR